MYRLTISVTDHHTHETKGIMAAEGKFAYCLNTAIAEIKYFTGKDPEISSDGFGSEFTLVSLDGHREYSAKITIST